MSAIALTSASLFGLCGAVLTQAQRLQDAGRGRELLRLLLNQAPVGIAAYGADRRPIVANELAVRWLGRAQKRFESLGDPVDLHDRTGGSGLDQMRRGPQVGGRDDNPVHLLLEKEFDGRGLEFVALVAAGYNHTKAVAARHIAHRAQDACVKCVSNVGGDDPDGAWGNRVADSGVLAVGNFGDTGPGASVH